MASFFSIAGTWVIKIKNDNAKEADVQRRLNKGNWGSIVGIACSFLDRCLLPVTMTMALFGEGNVEITSMRVFGAVLVRSIVGGAILLHDGALYRIR